MKFPTIGLGLTMLMLTAPLAKASSASDDYDWGKGIRLSDGAVIGTDMAPTSYPSARTTAKQTTPSPTSRANNPITNLADDIRGDGRPNSSGPSNGTTGRSRGGLTISNKGGASGNIHGFGSSSSRD